MLVSAVVLPMPAYANLWCVGTLANLWIDEAGTVFVQPSWHVSYVQLCNVNQNTANGVTPIVCMSWVALVRAAMQRTVPTIIYYNNVAVASCDAMPIYQASPIPYYVMLTR